MLNAAPDRAALRAHLVATRIAGDVATPRENNLATFARLAARHPGYTFGLDLDRDWTAEQVLALMAERVGVDPDPDHTAGADTIDPDRTLDRLEALADRLAVAARRRERLLVATGHPTGLLALHLPVAAALAAAGCELLHAGDGTRTRTLDAGVRIRFVGGVGMVTDGASLLHTHAPQPMRSMLAALDAPPDLVLADHGYAGAAGAAGIDAVGYADCNDPALFAGEAEGRVRVVVPLDDNVLPRHYGPLAAYLVERIRAA